jgi:KDPG and KHG aldolase
MMINLIETTANRVRVSGIIVIVRGNFSLKQTVNVAEQLISADINIMEVTLNSYNALEAIHQLRQDMGERLLVGAGNVRVPVQIAEAQMAAMSKPAGDAPAPACAFSPINRTTIRAVYVKEIGGWLPASDAGFTGFDGGLLALRDC